MSKATVADSIVAPAVTEALDAQPIDPPTITVTFGINDSPLAGREPALFCGLRRGVLDTDLSDAGPRFREGGRRQHTRAQIL